MPAVAIADTAHREETRGAATEEDHRAARANGGRGEEDPRRVTPGRLYIECRQHVRTRAKGIRKSETDTIAAEMLLRIAARIEEETHGAAATPWRNRPAIPAGRVLRWSCVGFLLRMEDGNTLVTRDGRRMLHAALKATLDAPNTWRETPTLEEPTDGATIAEMIEETDAPETRAPLDASATELARALSLPLSAARVVEAAVSYGASEDADGNPVSRTSALAREWGISPATVKSTLKDGKRALRQRYPDPATLLDALDAVAGALVAVAEDTYHLRTDDFRYAMRRAPTGALPVAEGRALHSAALRYSGAVAEVREEWDATIRACTRNGGKVIERTPWDALRPYRRDGLLTLSMAHGARTQRAQRIERAQLAAMIRRAATRRPTVARGEWTGRTVALLSMPPEAYPYPVAPTVLPILYPARAWRETRERMPRGTAPTGVAVAGCGCQRCHDWRAAHAR